MLKIISKRKFYYTFSLTLVIVSLVLLSTWGLKSGIDFTGGSLLEVSFKNLTRPASNEIQDTLKDVKDLGEVIVQPVGDNNVILRFKHVTENEHQEILKKLQVKFAPDQAKTLPAGDGSNVPVTIEGAPGMEIKGFTVESDKGPSVAEERFDSIGPSIGAELKTKSLYAIILVNLAIVAYIAWSFRKVGRPVQSWKYGITAIVALMHDVIITCGFFSFLGHYYGVEINTAFIVAILTVLGYSVNDTIVVFDRIRENLHRYQGDFSETVNISVNQTMVRSINTSLTVMLTLLAIFLFGGASIKFFALVLIVGVFFGTYSSIFVASSLLVTWQNLVRKFSR